MKRKVVQIQVEWEWLEANVMPDFDDSYEREYHQEQFDRDALQEYMRDILSHFLDDPDPVYIKYWKKVMRPTEENFQSFKNYFVANGFGFSDGSVYHRLFFISLVLWRNFTYNGGEKSNRIALDVFKKASEFHSVQIGHGKLGSNRRRLLDERRKGNKVDIALKKQGVKEGTRIRGYIYWTGKLFGPISEMENVKTEKRTIDLIGLLFCTATSDFREKYKSYLAKEDNKEEKKKESWNRYLYQAIRSYLNQHPSFTKETLIVLEKFILKLNEGVEIKLNDPIIPDYVRKHMKWPKEDSPLTTDEIERFIYSYSRHRPYFTKKGIWPVQYDSLSSKTRIEIRKKKRKAKWKKELAKLDEMF